jgi:RNA polymerase sigma factor (sigma-70 family)
MHDLRKALPISKEEEVAYFTAYKKAAGYTKIAIRDRIIQANLRFVWKVAREYECGGKFSAIDLYGYGVEGLIHSIDLFDYTKEFKLISYAVWHIKNKILQHMRASGVIRIPGKRRKECDIEIKSLYQGIGCGSDDTEILLIDTIEDYSFRADLHSDQAESQSIYNSLLEGLSADERDLVLDFYKITENEGQKEIAKTHNRSREWARQTRKRAMRRLHKDSRNYV